MWYAKNKLFINSLAYQDAWHVLTKAAGRLGLPSLCMPVPGIEIDLHHCCYIEVVYNKGVLASPKLYLAWYLKKKETLNRQGLRKRWREERRRETPGFPGTPCTGNPMGFCPHFHPFNNCGNLFLLGGVTSCNVLLLEMFPWIKSSLWLYCRCQSDIPK